MRRLTLVRHAKSSWDDPGMTDFERPLNARGRRDAPVMAARVQPLLHPAVRLMSSPARRALSTARVFAEVLGIPFEQIGLEPRIYEASRETLSALVRQLPADTRDVVLFGHNPGLTELAHWLAPCPFRDMPTCAVAHLALEVDHWHDVVSACGRVDGYLFPKDGGD